MAKSNKHITNINRLLENIKYNVLANFIYTDNKEIVITTNKVVTNLDLKVIENYIKNIDEVDMNNIINSRFLQSKSYLKILDILYFVEDTNLSITLDIVERILQSTHIFNDIVLTFYLCVIKASLKSNIAVVWIDIWNSQNSSKMKNLINK